MAISDLPILTILRTRMQWHQERQRLLAENVANADTPNFKPRDLAPLDLRRSFPGSVAVALARTDPEHLGGSDTASAGHFPFQPAARYEIRPAGNAVNLEDEMLKVASNQMDHQAAATLYSRSLGLIKLAAGRK
ncbi:MAG TPA: flagellar basal body rod protein FlgB [Xanthobacteraceae bacterium]|nr:flagellar basal body rod protein FlgB [Xanthobacteraceae bacterium]